MNTRVELREVLKEASTIRYPDEIVRAIENLIDEKIAAAAVAALPSKPDPETQRKIIEWRKFVKNFATRPDIVCEATDDFVLIQSIGVALRGWRTDFDGTWLQMSPCGYAVNWPVAQTMLGALQVFEYNSPAKGIVQVKLRTTKET